MEAMYLAGIDDLSRRLEIYMGMYLPAAVGTQAVVFRIERDISPGFWETSGMGGAVSIFS